MLYPALRRYGLAAQKWLPVVEPAPLHEWLSRLRPNRAALFATQIAAGPAFLPPEACSIFETALPPRPVDAHQDEEFQCDIRQSGQRVPVVARMHPRVVGAIEIVDGARRLQAIAAVNRRSVTPISIAANILTLTDREAFVLAYVRQQERTDLSLFDRARSIADAHGQHFRHDTATLAQRLNIPSTEIKRLIRLGRIPSEIFAALGPTAELTGEHIEPLISRMRARGGRTAILNRARQIAIMREARTVSGYSPLAASGVIDDLCSQASSIRTAKVRIEVRTKKMDLVAQIETLADGRGLIHIQPHGNVSQDDRFEALHRAVGLLREAESRKT